MQAISLLISHINITSCSPLPAYSKNEVDSSLEMDAIPSLSAVNLIVSTCKFSISLVWIV